MKAIETRKIVKKFGALAAVDGVDLEIDEGELFGLLGVNGAGKTTLIRMLSGLIRPTDGKGLVYGKDVVSEVDELKKIIDVSPQETSVAPNLTVEENLKFFAEIYGISGEEGKRKAEEITEIFGLREVLKRRAKTLSGGWQRRLSVAIAMISQPKILFLDEPTLGLDVLARRELWNVIRRIKGKVTIILTSHYLEEIEALCDRVAVMVKGKIVACGTVEELKRETKEEKFEEAFIKLVERRAEA